MTSGQCTIGAMTKVRVWAPKLRVSPSFTVTQRSVRSISKNWGSMAKVFALPTSFIRGYFSASFPMLPAWSGSMWDTIR